MKAVDRFRGSEHGILIATDIAARGLDIPGVRTVIHYQLPHAAEVYQCRFQHELILRLNFSSSSLLLFFSPERRSIILSGLCSQRW